MIEHNPYSGVKDWEVNRQQKSIICYLWAWSVLPILCMGAQHGQEGMGSPRTELRAEKRSSNRCSGGRTRTQPRSLHWRKTDLVWGLRRVFAKKELLKLISKVSLVKGWEDFGQSALLEQWGEVEERVGPGNMCPSVPGEERGTEDRGDTEANGRSSPEASGNLNAPQSTWIPISRAVLPP